MAKKIYFTDSSLETLVSETKAYTDNAVSTKANSSHNHSASNITSGTMDAARLPKASNTAAGIVTTSDQTFAGTKRFNSKIYPTGIETSSGIMPSAAYTCDIGSGLKPFGNIYAQNLYVDSKVAAGSVLYGGAFRKEREGTTTSTGVVRLEVGNPIASGNNGNTRGYIEVYNENTGSVTFETSHDDDRNFRVYLPENPGTLITDDDTYTKEDFKWNLLYDSGEIPNIVNSISGIDVSGYTNIQVLVRLYNDGDSVASRAGSAIFTAQNGKTYQFPVWSNMFSKSINTTYTMAQFNLVDGWLVCPSASRLIGDVDIFTDTEGGTAGNFSPVGSGMMRCTSPLSTLTVSSLDQNANTFFGVGSRVMVWGWNA